MSRADHPAERRRRMQVVATDNAHLIECTTSDGSRGWRATKLGFASRMGSTYRLDPLTASELGELT